MTGLFQDTTDGTFITITPAHGWDGLFDASWIEPGTGLIGQARLSGEEVAEMQTFDHIIRVEQGR